METSKELSNTAKDKLIAELRRLEELGLIERVGPDGYRVTELGKQAITETKKQ
jgi:Mn-dependent DtxR family transcriptional regulator